ncbi:zinc dependent phospholipase C family protein [Clostridium vincentii]|uniref:Phospholipase C/D domain-containing protein n=1 Tax=Clostridium vincentii TaxID=52704 RepID=A0A2T0BD49_9CLOT|nr:zinc dependent phospholipase C family protein [Clostridium vincentii]PRR81830.1 hypothetical protein CLVI_21760 [Clostridium vincentii]
MDTLLHGKLGYVLGKELKEDYKDISIGYFIYGNILPDLSPQLRLSMHTKKKDWKYVLKLMEELLLKSHKLSIRSKSIKFGIMTHYLCDFFTFPHNDGYTDSIIQHEIYEQLQRIIFWNKLKDIWKEFEEDTKVKLRTFQDIIVYIEDMHIIYNNNKSDKKRDLQFISILVRVVSHSLLALMRGETKEEKVAPILLNASSL